MSAPRETLALLHRLDEMRARLAPLEPIVRDFERDWDELANVRKSRKGTKEAREALAKPIAARMEKAWPLVDRVTRSRLLIKKLHDQVAETEGAQFDFDKAAHVDSLWGEIRAIRELVPLAQAGKSVKEGRREGGQKGKIAKQEAKVARMKDLSRRAAGLGTDKITVQAAILSDQGLGGRFAIEKLLREAKKSLDR